MYDMAVEPHLADRLRPVTSGDEAGEPSCFMGCQYRVQYRVVQELTMKLVTISSDKYQDKHHLDLG
jgi:hypothetical protein